MSDPLKPSITVLVKLGSIAVHSDELMSPDGREVDRLELQTRLQDPELVEWLEAMTKLAFLPVKRIVRTKKRGKK